MEMAISDAENASLVLLVHAHSVHRHLDHLRAHVCHAVDGAAVRPAVAYEIKFDAVMCERPDNEPRRMGSTFAKKSLCVRENYESGSRRNRKLSTTTYKRYFT